MERKPTSIAVQRRAAPRFTVEGVEGTLLLVAEARVLDLSVGGIALSTHSPLRIGRTYSLALSYGGTRLNLQGDVVWCHLVRTEKTAGGDTLPVYEAGLRFGSILSHKAEELVRFLEASAVLSLETRLGGRFKLADAGTVDLNAALDLQVRQLSATGMPIELEAPPPEVGAICELEVGLPEGTFAGRGRVASIVPGAPTGRCRVGIELLETDGDDRQALEVFISSQLE